MPWHYEPEPTRLNYRRRWLWLLTMVALLAITAEACGSNSNSASNGTTTSTSTTTATAATPACTKPCAEASGLVVEVRHLVFNAASGNQFSTPEQGNVFVMMDVNFINNSKSNHRVSPIDFKLRSAGVEHTTKLGLTACPYWSGVEVTPGASYGPKCLAFEAAANQPTGLVVVWKPGFSKTYDIPVS